MAGLPKARVNNLNQRMHDVGIFDQDLTLEDAQAINAFYNYTCLNCGKKPASSIDLVKQRDETPGGKPARIVLEYK